MKNYRLSQLLVSGLLVLLAACQASEQPLNSAMIKSGDTLNGMGLTTGAADAPPLWAFCSRLQESSQIKTLSCHAPVLPALAIGHIFLVGDEVLATSDWSDFAWELSIDDQPVDLNSFGTFEYMMPTMSQSPSHIREAFKKASAWDIVLTDLNPGEHTLQFLAQNGTDRYSWFVNLAIEPANGTDISSVPFALKS